jgi:RNA polymerase sigma-70 factor (ECF subfamily)
MTTSASTYAQFASLVRRRLAGLGVRAADVPDLCQEVFLLVHGRRDILPDVDRLDLWLREICRRVAAGYRRRAGHRFEVFGHDPQVFPDLCAGIDANLGGDRDEERELARMAALLRQALNHLDDESRDLLALHDAGGMPLAQLARLVAHDRKTLRTRLVRARRRMSRWLGGGRTVERVLPAGDPVRTTPPESPLMRQQAARGRAEGCVAAELTIVRVSPEVCSGAIGNVAVSDWRGPEVSPATIDSMIERAVQTVKTCGGDFIYFAVIEPTMRPPTLEARQKIADALEIVGPYLSGFAVVCLAADARINQPILEGMRLLVRPRFPMAFFSSVAEAAAWSCATTARGAAGPLAPAELIAAAERLRRLEVGPPAGSRHARAHRVVS